MRKEKILITVAQEDIDRKDINDVLRCKDDVEKVFLGKSFLTETVYLKAEDFNNIEIMKKNIIKYKPAAVFNLFEGFSNDAFKEAEFVRILEDIDIPFTGNSSYTLELCLNKQKVKEVLKTTKAEIPQGYFIEKIEDLNRCFLQPPLFIKPCFCDASLGIDCNSLVMNEERLHEVVAEKLKKFPEGLIMEEFISGREYNAGFLGNYPEELLGISVLDYSKYDKTVPFLSYGAKWEENCHEFKTLLPSVQTAIEERVCKKIVDTCRIVCEKMKCRNYFRIDLREKDGDIFVLDVNPNPDINKDSGFMKQAYSKGYKYEDVIEKIWITSMDFYKKEKSC